MGCDCDIHVIVERKNGDGNWHRVPTRGVYDRPNKYGISKDNWRPLRPGEVDQPDALTSRNYDVFALLANVRNGVGFAGIQTSEGWQPLSEPRGLPADTTYREREDDDDAPWLGDHSHSFATVAELLAFFATPQHTTQYGVVTVEEYKQLTARGTWGDRRAPQSYCGGISGHNLRTIEEVEKDRDRTLAEAARLKATHIRMSWPETVFDAAASWVDSVLPWLTALGDPETVRIVFGFDS